MYAIAILPESFEGFNNSIFENFEDFILGYSSFTEFYPQILL